MRPNINFKQIEAFRAVMRTGSATRAAVVMHTTQPSISRRLAELQNATQLKLFDLRRGRLQPTDEGEFLYRAIEQHFLGLEKIETIVSVMRRSGTSSLRLACTPTLGAGWLPPLVQRFVQLFPDTHVTIQTASTPQIEELLDQGLVDIALTTGEFRRQDARPAILDRRKVVCILPRNHPLCGASRIELPMLARERLISISEDDELSSRIRAEFLKGATSEHVAVHTNSSITICALVAAGTGIGIVTPYITDMFAGRIAVKPLRASIAVDLRLATPVNRTPSMLANEFIKLAKKRAGGLSRAAHIESLT
ncbi:MAG TPA: LysR substrate-binding domain-containing protein [Rubrivivax sp.]|nr:LysR substrate-binding domain-containing protein [Rubrivivax sp.]